MKPSSYLKKAMHRLGHDDLFRSEKAILIAHYADKMHGGEARSEALTMAAVYALSGSILGRRKSGKEIQRAFGVGHSGLFNRMNELAPFVIPWAMKLEKRVREGDG